MLTGDYELASSLTLRFADNAASNSRFPRAIMPKEIAPHVHVIPILFVNAYTIHTQGDDWVLVDTGVKLGLPALKNLEEEFGKPPVAIVLTHGHFDHSSNAFQLAELWNIPIYVGAREKPYLDGEEAYPPFDPTVGGALAFLTRFFPSPVYDFGDRLQIIPASGELPCLPGWKIIETPGHSPGHVSLWDEETKTLIAGDAICTADFDKWPGAMIQQPQQLARSASPATPDWNAAIESTHKLADLEPQTIGAGHGRPMSGGDVAGALRDFAQAVKPPEHGRYVGESATYAADGSLIALPSRVKDPMGLSLIAGAGAGALLTLVLASAVRSRMGRDEARELPKIPRL